MSPSRQLATRRIRVAHLVDTLEIGGAERQLVTVATGVDRDRIEPSVICLTRRGPFERELAAAGVPVHLIGKRHKAGGQAFLRLRAALRQQRPDILQTWMFTCNLFGRLAAKGLPIRVLASEVAADPTKSAVRLAVDRVLAKTTPAFYVNSRTVAEFYHAKCGIPFEKLVVIPNGIDVREVEPVARHTLSVPADSYLVGCAGRLSPEKGFDRVIEALASPALRTRRVHVVFAGDGPMRGPLEALAQQLGVADRVRLLGYREDLPRVLKALDLFVLASLHEGMPNALMEAMAQGVPCVVTPVGGVAELVRHGESGVVLDRSAAEPIARAIADLMDAPGTAVALGRAGRRHMQESFSVQENVRRFEDLYRRLVDAG
jgi:glycosyltransferase involved in cell wall biosynthesis